MATLDMDGWELESAEERHRANPASFSIPSAEERASLSVGERVKLLFLFASEREGRQIVACERMWVRITAADRGVYVGRMENMPATSTALDEDAVIEFGPEHVSAVMIPRTDPRHPEYQPPCPNVVPSANATREETPERARRGWEWKAGPNL